MPHCIHSGLLLNCMRVRARARACCSYLDNFSQFCSNTSYSPILWLGERHYLRNRPKAEPFDLCRYLL